jgi:hypothetical protein
MGCNSAAKGAKTAGGKGDNTNKQNKGNGRGGGGKGGAATSGKGKGDKQAAKFDKQFASLEAKLTKAVAAMTAVAGQAKAVKPAAAGIGKQYWTCPACGDDRCFSSRTSCHKCGVARAPQPAGLPMAVATAAASLAAGVAAAAAGAEDPMITEAIPIEDQIVKLEAEVKVLKQASLPQTKALLVSLEAELLQLREQQRQARPLPARLQAATHRLEKFKTAQAEAAESIDSLKAKLEAEETAKFEIDAKVAEAEAEMQAVKRQVADGEAASVISRMKQVLCSSMDAGLAASLVSQVSQLYGSQVASGPAAAAAMQGQLQQSAAQVAQLQQQVQQLVSASQQQQQQFQQQQLLLQQLSAQQPPSQPQQPLQLAVALAAGEAAAAAAAAGTLGAAAAAAEHGKVRPQPAAMPGPYTASRESQQLAQFVGGN